MTGKSGRGTARQTVRLDEALWTEFGEAATNLNTDRTALIRDYIAWFLRKPNAKDLSQAPEQDGEEG